MSYETQAYCTEQTMPVRIERQWLRAAVDAVKNAKGVLRLKTQHTILDFFSQLLAAISRLRQTETKSTFSMSSNLEN